MKCRCKGTYFILNKCLFHVEHELFGCIYSVLATPNDKKAR